MALFKDQDFEGQTIHLDGNQYANCNFRNCSIVYSGGEVPKLARCNFTGETWRFEGAAERTLILLQDFARAGSGFDSLVKSCFPDLFKPN
jgi:hypothetical protein